MPTSKPSATANAPSKPVTNVLPTSVSVPIIETPNRLIRAPLYHTELVLTTMHI